MKTALVMAVMWLGVGIVFSRDPHAGILALIVATLVTVLATNRSPR